MRSAGITRARVAAALTSVLIVAACSSSGGGATPASTSTTTTTDAPPIDDGVLRIGVLLPVSGEGALIAQSARAAVDAAVKSANAAGGINGEQVVLLVRDEGSDSASAAVALQQLLDSRIDVLIGPASSNITIALIPTMTDAGIASCSPTASALALDAFPDNGLFFRTIPSDSLQAEAMAKVIEQTGDNSASIAYIDDGYGRPFEQALQARLRARGIAVDTSVGFSSDDDEYDTEAARVINAGSGSGAIALIGADEAGSRMLAALAAASVDDTRDIVLNDALRRPWSLSLVRTVDRAARMRIVGVSPVVLTENEELLAQIRTDDPNATGLFASQAFDCANLFMLAAERADSALATDIARSIPDISSVGSSCATFVDCAAILAEGRSIDYEGADGLLTIGNRGDVLTARYDQYSFDETGRDQTTQTILASSLGTALGS